MICTFPGYQSLYQLALSIGCEVTFWEPSENEGWRFDPAWLEKNLRPDTKLVVWNFPHNPTGALPAADDFARMIAAAGAAGAWLFSDEMYRLLEPSADLRLPAAVDRYERAVSLSGMSKAFGLAGLRIGWVATHDAGLLERMKALKDYTTICSSAPSELLALMALRSRDAIVAAHRERVRRNIRAAGEFFGRHPSRFSWVPPRAGTVCFPRLLPGARRTDAERRSSASECSTTPGCSCCRRPSTATGTITFAWVWAGRTLQWDWGPWRPTSGVLTIRPAETCAGAQPEAARGGSGAERQAARKAPEGFPRRPSRPGEAGPTTAEPKPGLEPDSFGVRLVQLVLLVVGQRQTGQEAHAVAHVLVRVVGP